MGFLDNILGLFTGSTAEKAGQQARQYLGQQSTQVGQAIGGAQTTGLDALRSGALAGREALGTGFDQARGDLTGYGGQAAGALTDYGGQGLDALRSTLGQATGAIDSSTAGALGLLQNYGREGIGALQSGVQGALGSYDPLSALATTYGERATGASDMLGNALGLGGPEGTARVQAAFQASPGYQFNLDQGLEAINRARAARGELSGGNIDRDTQTYGAGLASREYGDFLNRLGAREGLYAPMAGQLTGAGAAGRAGAHMTGAGGIASLLGSLGTGGANLTAAGGRSLADLLSSGGARQADLFKGIGAGLADVYGGTGRGLAELGAKEGAGQAGIYTGEGQGIADLVRQLAGTQATFTGQMAPNYASTFMTEAAAKSAGAKNFLDLLGSAATFGAGGGFNPASWTSNLFGAKRP